jgi:hypothetical protein
MEVLIVENVQRHFKRRSECVCVCVCVRERDYVGT